MKEEYYDSIIDGVNKRNFPPVPVDYGYRDSTNFWCSKFKKPYPEKIQAKEGDVNSVKYAASRIDPAVKFTDEACAKLTKIPRVFLKAALTQMVEIAKSEGISLIDEKALACDIIRKTKRVRTDVGLSAFRHGACKHDWHREKGRSLIKIVHDTQIFEFAHDIYLLFLL